MILARLKALREQMKQHGMDAYIVHSADPHNSEYSAAHWHARRFLSGFTGSAGTLVVTQNGGALWADGRYHIQAEEELQDSGLQLQKQGLPTTPELDQWLFSTLPNQATIGFDGRTFDLARIQGWQGTLAAKKVSWKTHLDLLNEIWTDRPPLPISPLQDHAVTYAGVSREDKLTQLRSYMSKRSLTHYLVSALDDVAWLTNTRGGDVAYCPVAEAYALVTMEAATLYIDPAKVSESLRQALTKSGYLLAGYEQVGEQLQRCPPGSRLQLDPNTTNYQLFQSLPNWLAKQLESSQIAHFKAIKNPTEQQHFRTTLATDGVAFVRFAHWLEHTLKEQSITELEAEQVLAEFRSMNPDLMDLSFRTIAGYGANGAKMHYAASADKPVQISTDSFFLIDSGGQYPGGTTDITRTFHFGTPTEQQKSDYTLVLKGVIALSQARFLEGTMGIQLDIIARQHFWQQAINYGCGTGHGVGFCLNVHEGPHSLSPKWIREPLKPGMLVTNEPGVYRQNEYGIRIENILLVQEDTENAFGRFYRFETLTLAPISKQALDPSLLNQNERNWLNQYHQQVEKELSPHLNEDERLWLHQACQPI